jgi:glycosyltransferase involved in cell wall biosynthesis
MDCVELTRPMLKQSEPSGTTFGPRPRSNAVPLQRGVRPLRLAFVCGGDPLNVRTWSGTPFHMLQALKAHADVVEVVRSPWPAWFDLPRRAIRRLSKLRYDFYWSPFLSGLGGRATVDRLANTDCDAVVAVAITPVAARLAERVPTVFVSDATFPAMSDYNIYFQKLSPTLKRGAEHLEGSAIRRAIVATFPSRWAQSSAIEHLRAEPDQTHQIPWGANLKARTTTPVEDRPAQPWRLLFVGVDWYGKGGDTVLQTFRMLKERGHSVELDIVGCAPGDPPPVIEGVTFHGFISKNTPEGRDRLEELFRRAHLFVLPTRFDAFPTVIAESASFGVPAISYRTGGLPSNVIDGETGILIEEGKPAEAFADAIVSLMSDPQRYKAMANAAIRFSREALNWDAWARNIVASVAAALDKRDAQAAVAS